MLENLEIFRVYDLLGGRQHSETSKIIVFVQSTTSIWLQIPLNDFDGPTYNPYQSVKSVHT